MQQKTVTALLSTESGTSNLTMGKIKNYMMVKYTVPNGNYEGVLICP